MTDKIALEQIDISIFPNPRSGVTPVSVKELARSIKAEGQLQPVGVLKTGDGVYALAYGFRRFEAVKSLGRTEIDCYVLPAKTKAKQIPLLQLAENVVRENLNRLDEARAYEAAKESGVTVAVIGKSIGKSKGYVSQVTSILKADESVIEALNDGQITFTDARNLCELPNTNAQANALAKAIKSTRAVLRTARIDANAEAKAEAEADVPIDDDLPTPNVSKATVTATKSAEIKKAVADEKKAGGGKDSTRFGQRPGRKKGSLVLGATMSQEIDDWVPLIVNEFDTVTNAELENSDRALLEDLVRFGCLAKFWGPMNDPQGCAETYAVGKAEYDLAVAARGDKGDGNGRPAKPGKPAPKIIKIKATKVKVQASK